MIEEKNALEKAMLELAEDTARKISELPTEFQQLAHAAMSYASAEQMPLHQVNDGNISQYHMKAIAVGVEAAAKGWKIAAEADYDEFNALEMPED